MASSWYSKCDDVDTFGIIFTSNSEKNLKKDVPEKHVSLGERQNARPGAISPSDPTQDVRPHRTNGAICNGKVKAGTQNAPHLRPGFERKRGTSDNQTQNYQ